MTSIAVLPNSISVSYSEVAQENAPAEEMGDVIQAKRILKCAWGSRWALAQQLMPGVVSSGGGVTLTMPHRYPYRTDLGLYCTSVSIEPWVGNPSIGTPGPHLDSGPKLAWEWALLHASYTTLQGSGEYSIIFQEQLAPCAEFVTLPATDSDGNVLLFWDAAKTKPIADAQAPGFLLRRIEWTVTRRYMPLSFSSIYLSYLGKINTNDIVSGVFSGLSFPAGQLLYNGLQIEPDRFSDGKPAVKAIMHFTFQNVNWNLFAHPVAGAASLFAKIYDTAGAEYKPYTDTTLEDLFA